ncbi:MAG TPA: arylsulfatase [Phycisphaerae bacterium]|nr:arylsulfatase [Phycisphaerae bacterium]
MSAPPLPSGNDRPVSPPTARPNILFLMTDQHRGDCIGADGNKVIRTPNIDRLAAEGARFARAYTSTPSCTPARAAILTGLSPWHHGLLGAGRQAETYKPELPAMLRDAGYYTYGIGKMHFHPQRALHGFERTILDESGREESPEFRSDYRSWFWSLAPTLDPGATGLGWNDYRARPYALPEKLHPTRWTADAAVSFLKDYKEDKPFFLKVSFERPHSPYDPPPRFWKMYEDADVPPAVIGDWSARYAADTDPSNYNSWHGDFGPEQVRVSRRAYYGSISFIDEQIGRILKTLEERGWLDSTLILFTADHGDMLGDHHLWRKTYAYEGSARIPMLVRWPENMEAKRGQVFDQPTELRDLLPTFLDAAGVKFDPSQFDGQSLLKLVRGETDDWRPWIDLEHSQCYGSAGYWNALTDGRIKYVFYALDGRQYLFDMAKDPGELHNLADDPAHAELLGTWRSRLMLHLNERGEPFVKDGDLVVGRPNVTYSPHFPWSNTGAPASARKRR